MEETKNEVVILKRTTENKIKMAPDLVKEFYSGLRNELMSYPSVKERMLIACDTYKVGKVVVAKIALAGKVMKLYLPLDVNKYEVSKFHQNDASDTKSYATTPFMVKVNSKLGLKKAKTLIDDVMAELGLQKIADYVDTDFAKLYPYVENGEFEKATRKKTDDVVEEEAEAAPVAKKAEPASPKTEQTSPKVEVVEKKAPKAEVKEKVVEVKVKPASKPKAVVNTHTSKKTHKGVVNLGAIDHAFSSGVVDLEALQAKGLLNYNVGSYKVLGNGNLTKALTIKADKFSKSALAKIEAAGGTAK